jgi:hypothetical protein
MFEITARQRIERILPSVPHMGGREEIYVGEGFAAN